MYLKRYQLLLGSFMIGLPLFSLVDRDANLNAHRYFLFMSASVHQQQNQMVQAEEAYKELFALNPPVAVYENYIKFLFGSQQFAKITALPAHILAQFENNIDVELSLAQALLYTGRLKEADARFEKLTQKHGDHEQVAYYVVQYYMHVGQATKALAMLEKFLANTSLKAKHSLFYFLQSKIYLQINKPQKALEAIKESLKLYPNFDKGWLFKGLLHEQLGHVSDAIAGYKKYLDVSGADETIEKRVINLLFRENRFNEAAEIMKKFDNGTAPYYFEMALINFKGNDAEKALEYLGQALKVDQNMAQALLLKADILLSMGKQEEALDLITTWIERNPSDPTAFEALLLIIKAGAHPETVLKSLRKISPENRPQELEFLEADLLLRSKQFNAARKHYEHALTTLKVPLLVSFCHFQVGYSYLQEGKQKEGLESLEEAISQSVIYPSAYNALAYELAKMGKNLDRALLLSSQARKNAPTNPYFLHTEGFIYEKLGNTARAKTCYEKALEGVPGDAVIQKSLKELAPTKKP